MGSPILDRRTLLGGTVAMGALAILEVPAMPKQHPTFFERIALPIGLQLYTLGEEAGRDLDATFAQVAALGYRDIEVPNLYGRSAREVGAAASRAGLAISSLHLPVSTFGQGPGLSMTSPPAEIADSIGALGAKHAVAPIASFPEGFRPQLGANIQAAIGRAFADGGETPWKRTAAILNEKAAVLKPLGVSVGYHNHNIEFAPIGKTNGWEILLHECDPELVSFEIDTGWIATAGLDPVAFLEKHRGRVTQLHVKDVAPTNKTNFSLAMDPAEVGSGKLDWKRVLPAAHKAGVLHYYVEQEPPFSIPRMEAVRRSYAFLSQLRA